MKKIIDFIKNKKDFIFGILYMYLCSVFMLYFNNLFKLYNIDFIHRILILISFGCSLTFWKKGFELLFSKDKRGE